MKSINCKSTDYAILILNLQTPPITLSYVVNVCKRTRFNAKTICATTAQTENTILIADWNRYPEIDRLWKLVDEKHGSERGLYKWKPASPSCTITENSKHTDQLIRNKMKTIQFCSSMFLAPLHQKTPSRCSLIRKLSEFRSHPKADIDIIPAFMTPN
jgi:hypothetical protein